MRIKLRQLQMPLAIAAIACSDFETLLQIRRPVGEPATMSCLADALNGIPGIDPASTWSTAGIEFKVASRDTMFGDLHGFVRSDSTAETAAVLVESAWLGQRPRAYQLEAETHLRAVLDTVVRRCALHATGAPRCHYEYAGETGRCPSSP